MATGKSKKTEKSVKSFDTVVVGGGQTGLTTGYYLQKAKRDYIILDAQQEIGDAWRKRWDSLLLFTPARFNGLPGLRFPASRASFTTKDEMADYLKFYTKHFFLNVKTSTKVEKVTKKNGIYKIITNQGVYNSKNLVIAMVNYERANVPSFADKISSRIKQLHSSEYLNAKQLDAGKVLIVGVGNSGGDIALDVVKTHPIVIAGKEPGFVPFRIESFIARHFLISIVRFTGHHVFNQNNPLGRNIMSKMMGQGTPLVRVKPKDFETANAERVGRIVSVRNGAPVTESDEVLDVDNIIWCTGFKADYSWLEIPVFDSSGRPKHKRGVVETCPGLYFVGLHFQHAATSDTVTGMPRDVRFVMKQMKLVKDR